MENSKDQQLVTIVMSAHYYTISPGGWIDLEEEKETFGISYTPVPKDQQSSMAGYSNLKEDYIFITGTPKNIRSMVEGCTCDCSYTQLVIYLSATPIALVREFINDILDGWQDLDQSTYNGHFIL